MEQYLNIGDYIKLVVTSDKLAQQIFRVKNARPIPKVSVDLLRENNISTIQPGGTQDLTLKVENILLFNDLRLTKPKMHSLVQLRFYIVDDMEVKLLLPYSAWDIKNVEIYTDRFMQILNPDLKHTEFWQYDNRLDIKFRVKNPSRVFPLLKARIVLFGWYYLVEEVTETIPEEKIKYVPVDMKITR